MTVFELQQALKNMPDNAEVVKSTSDGLYRARNTEPTVLEFVEGSSYLYEPYSLDLEPDDDATRKVFVVIR